MTGLQDLIVAQAQVAGDVLLTPRIPHYKCGVCEVKEANAEREVKRFTREGVVIIPHCNECFDAIAEAL